VTTTESSDRFTTLPDDQTLAATVVALEEHGYSVEVVDDLDAAREAVLARIPNGSSVMTNTSVTLEETGIAEAINNGGPYDLYDYAKGNFDATKTLMAHVQDEGNLIDLIVYPICFDFRHAVELYIKYVITDLAKVKGTAHRFKAQHTLLKTGGLRKVF